MKDKQKFTMVLAGNPNVGKSTVFNALTGMHQHTGNWPGKTVDVAVGTFSTGLCTYCLFDVPGTYSLFARSPEEEVARDAICNSAHRGVIVVCDGTCLERNIGFVLQILSVTNRVVVCVNLLDEAQKRGIHIDLEQLSQELGVQVVGTSARTKKGLDQLRNAVDSLALSEEKFPEKTAEEVENTPDIVEKRHRLARDICSRVVHIEEKENTNRDSKIDKIVTGKVLGYPLMLLLLSLIFWITIKGANYPSAILSTILFDGQDFFLEKAMESGIPPWLYEPLILGVYRVVAWVVSVMLPPMAIFFPLFTILEDSGYLPRIAYNLDRPFCRCSACGKQALTMCMGFGCNAVGVEGCRIIDSPRERLLAILTNNFVPCNGRFPTLIALFSLFFAGVGVMNGVLPALLLTGAIVFGILVTLETTKILSKTLLRGEPSAFTLELPPYRRPQFLKVIFRSVFDRTLFVLGRALSAAAPAGLVIWFLTDTTVGTQSLLSYLCATLEPIGKLFGMDGVILVAFLLGIPANEIVVPIMIMAYTSQNTLVDAENLTELASIFEANGWTWVTALCVICFSLFHWPCATTLLTIRKETGSAKWTILSAILPTFIGFSFCFIISTLSSFL